MNNDIRIWTSYAKLVNKYKVEMHKKYAMPFACVIFVLIGAPMGIMTRKSSATIGVAVAMFFIYWVFMIGGEELADRLFMSPWMAMWLPNITGS